MTESSGVLAIGKTGGTIQVTEIDKDRTLVTRVQDLIFLHEAVQGATQLTATDILKVMSRTLLSTGSRGSAQ